MIVMGLDIASYNTGYFILDMDNIRYKIGLIKAKGDDKFDRIRQIHNKSKKILDAYNPDILVIEDTYLDEYRKKNNYRKRGNINTLKILEKTHGAIISNTKDYTDIFYMSPREHKEILTGFGGSSKQSTIWAVQKAIGIGKITDDEGDAAALVLSYLIKKKQWDILEKIKEKYET